MRILLLAAQVACSLAFAQPKLLNTPAARQFSDWLSAFNGTDRSAFRSFIEKNYLAGVKNVDPQGRLREQTGGFDLKMIEESTPTRFTGLVQERKSDQFARLQVSAVCAWMYADEKAAGQKLEGKTHAAERWAESQGVPEKRSNDRTLGRRRNRHLSG